MAAGTRWICELSSTDIAAIDHALEYARGARINPEQIDKNNFPLSGSKLIAKLENISHELETGCGFVRISGLSIEKYSDTELRTLFMGLAAYLGTPVSQNTEGQRLRAICDEGAAAAQRYGQMQADNSGGVFLSSRARTASTGPLRFHTDRTDIVGLFCIRQAKSGGISKIASIGAVHNEILAQRPDLLELLYQDYYRSRLGEEKGGEQAFYALPVFGLRDGQFTSHYSRTYIEAAQLLPDVPKMSDEQWQAIDMLAQTAEENCLEMRLQPGDMQFLNNHVIYHARTAFEDAPEQGLSRLLYRVWLCAPNNRALPAGHEVLWGDIEAGQLRGGIRPTA